jgi:hypothetical protein
MANYYSANYHHGGTEDNAAGNPNGNTNTSHNTNHNNNHSHSQHDTTAAANDTSSDPYANQNQQWNQPVQQNAHHQQHQHQQQQQQHQQHQQQHQGGSSPFWNPAMSTAFATAAASAVQGSSNPNAMLDVAGKIGNSFLDEGTARMIPGLEQIMRELRVYFAVDNSYCKTKMTRVLFPFFFKDWSRIQNDSHAMDKYALPRDDPNALDLYIPAMSLITYVLLCGLCYGTSGEFNPEVLPDVTTKCILIQFMEVLLFKVGFYLMQAPITIMDLFAVTGYKYLGLTMNMLVGYSLSLALVSGGHKGYYGTFLWTASASSYFIFKFMGLNIPDVTSATVNATGGPKKEIMVLVFAGSQFASMWFLGQTKFLN